MTPQELEARLLSCLRSIEDVLYCEEHGVSPDSFVVTEPDHAEIFRYIQDHSRQHSGILPTDEDLESLHGFKRSGKGDLSTYVQKVREDELGRRARVILLQEIEHLDEKPEAAIQGIVASLASLKTGTRRRVSYLDRDAMERLREFDEATELAKSGGVIGIPTGLRSFDAALLGFKKGELVIVMGSTGVGKSWMLMKMGVTAYENNRKVLLISPELTNHEQALRLDSVLAATRTQQLSNSELLTGQANRKEYAAWLDALTARSEFISVDSSDTGKSLSFEDVWRYAVEFKPDLVLVDGLHLLTSSEAKSTMAGWEMLKEGSKFLKALAQQEGIVIICATQATRPAAQDQTVPPGLSQISYAFSIGEAADRVISLSRVKGNELARRYSVPKLRGGKEIVEWRDLHWNVDVGEIWEEDNVPDDF
jgi:replicative DNA helicase